MVIFRACSATATVLVLLAATAGAAPKKPPGLEPFAGSYTGRAVSTTSAGALTASSTLTFTGKKRGLSGTFLYTGILNQNGESRNVVQTFKLNSKGLISGRVSVGDGQLSGIGSGKATLKKKRLLFTMNYALGNPTTTTITLAGSVTFAGRNAKMTANVTSNDPGFAGSLVVTGKR